MSMVRKVRPASLFRHFRRQSGYRLSNPYPGIYYVKGRVPFVTQIVVTGELEAEADF